MFGVKLKERLASRLVGQMNITRASHDHIITLLHNSSTCSGESYLQLIAFRALTDRNNFLFVVLAYHITCRFVTNMAASGRSHRGAIY